MKHDFREEPFLWFLDVLLGSSPPPTMESLQGGTSAQAQFLRDMSAARSRLKNTLGQAEDLRIHSTEVLRFLEAMANPAISRGDFWSSLSRLVQAIRTDPN